jgi:hypothetical protein
MRSCGSEQLFAAYQRISNDLFAACGVFDDVEAGAPQPIAEIPTVIPHVIVLPEMQFTILFGRDGAVFVSFVPPFDDRDHAGECPVVLQDPADLHHCGAVVDMLQDMIGDNRVEARVRHLDLLDVENEVRAGSGDVGRPVISHALT